MVGQTYPVLLQVFGQAVEIRFVVVEEVVFVAGIEVTVVQSELRIGCDVQAVLVEDHTIVDVRVFGFGGNVATFPPNPIDKYWTGGLGHLSLLP